MLLTSVGFEHCVCREPFLGKIGVVSPEIVSLSSSQIRPPYN